MLTRATAFVGWGVVVASALTTVTVGCNTSLNLGGDRDGGGEAGSDAGTSAWPDGATTTNPTFAAWPMPDDSPQASNYAIANGTATDKTTGLVWQQGIVIGRFSFKDAKQACTQLRLDGREDWLLPTRIELVSLINYETGSLFNGSVFADDQPACFWTSSSYAANPSSQAWQVASRMTQPSNVTDACAARCVRRLGGSSNAGVEFRGVVAIDHGTGLTWQQLPPTSVRTAIAADDYCTALSLGDYASGWRLPTIRELQTIVDERLHNPAFDPSFGSSSAGTWASTGERDPEGRNYAWIVRFADGQTISQRIDMEYNVRCVHP